MAHSSDFEARKRELCHSFDALADAMKNCAQIASNFSKYVAGLPPPDASPPSPDSLPDAKGKRKRVGTKPKKEKDPNAPKRPSSAYLHFQNDVRGWYKENNPGVPYSSLVDEMSRKWKELTPTEKEKYTGMVEEDKKRFLRETEEYRAKMGLGPKEKPKVKKAAAAKAPVAAIQAKPAGNAKEEDAPSVSGEESEDSDSEQLASTSHKVAPPHEDSEEEGDESSEEEAPPPPKKSKKSKV